MIVFMGLIILLASMGMLGVIAGFFKDVLRDAIQICINIYEDYFKKEGDK